MRFFATVLTLVSALSTGCGTVYRSHRIPGGVLPGIVPARIGGVITRTGQAVFLDSDHAEIRSDSLHATCGGVPVAIALADIQEAWVFQEEGALIGPSPVAKQDPLEEEHFGSGIIGRSWIGTWMPAQSDSVAKFDPHILLDLVAIAVAGRILVLTARKIAK